MSNDYLLRCGHTYRRCTGLKRGKLYGIESRAAGWLVQKSKHVDENFFVGYQNLRQHVNMGRCVTVLMTHEDSLSSALMNLAESGVTTAV